MWAINQTGLDLSDTLSTIWDEQSPDVAPVEYLPIVNPKAYFSKPSKMATEHVSGLLLEIFNDLSNELKSEK